MRNYHRKAGYVLLGIFITVSILCVYFFVLSSNKSSIWDARVTAHIILGTAGYIIFPLKILNVRRGNGYKKITPILGVILVAIFIGLFFTSAFIFF